MGLVSANLSLSNPRDPSIEPFEVAALADTGAVFLCIPEHVHLQLKLDVLQEREVSLADGACVSVPYVGPVVDPRTRTVDVNPASPNIAHGIVKRAA